MANRPATPGVRTSRTSAAGRGMAARTENYHTTRPETQQQSYESEAAPDANLQPLQQRLTNSRRTNRPASAAENVAPAPERVARRPANPVTDRAAWTNAEEPAEMPTPPPVEPVAQQVERPTNSGDEVLFTRQSAMLNVGTAGPKSVVIGKPASYRVVVQNAGNQPATAVVVSVRLPNWTEVVGNQPTTGSAAVSTSRSAGRSSRRQPRRRSKCRNRS
jgi:uncharacterized repeat protein (TIGR01451 family)